MKTGGTQGRERHRLAHLLTNGDNPHPRFSIREGHAYGASLQQGNQNAGSNPAASTIQAQGVVMSQYKRISINYHEFVELYRINFMEFVEPNAIV